MTKKKSQQSTPSPIQAAKDEVYDLPKAPLWKRVYIDIASDTDTQFSMIARKAGISKRALLARVITDYVKTNGGK